MLEQPLGEVREAAMACPPNSQLLKISFDQTRLQYGSNAA